MAIEYPLVMFCCNDRHGNTTNLIQNVEIHGADGETLLSLSTYEHASYTQDEAGRRIEIAGQWLPVRSPFANAVGSLFWNAAEMDYATLAAMLNHLKAQQWDCTEGESGLFDLWDSPHGAFTAEVLKTLPGTPTEQASRELRELLVPELA